MAIHKKTKAVDTIGMITSGLCAVHCAVLPFLFSFGIIGGASSAAHHSIELVVVVCSFGLGSWSIYQAMTSHKQLFPQLAIILGLMIILGGFFLSTPDNHTVMSIGGFVLVSGHWINRRYLQRKLA